VPGGGGSWGPAAAKRRRSFTRRLPLSRTLRLPHHEGDTMTDTVGVPGNRIRSFVERVEQLEGEIQELNESKKEVFAEAKGEGFDVKVLKEIIKLRKQNKDERDEHETLLDVYMRAMESSTPVPTAEAA
jgi:uncharacterized protein (UPF0335 family)